ncbi:hypothetical protein KYC5002_20085 [Archangium violaceum]|uniref:hypothetical protein n=1 Tax=Archangium violaceum TaxID=83451 RepID=UPI002B2C070B|nr:hypothetical protein KYC5002_20085 [Archangium gephyra]
MLLLCFGLGSPALAQHRPGPPPASGTPSEREIFPRTPPAPAGGGATVQRMPTCEEVRRRARYGIYFDKVDIEKLVQTVSDATCRTFILPENVRGKISIIGPENGKVEVDADQFYAAFLMALDANGLAVYQHGRFLKIVYKRVLIGCGLPTLKEDGADTTNEQMVTRLFRIKNGEVEPLRGVLQQLVSMNGDTIPYSPDIIINDAGSNMHRLEQLIQQLETRAASDEVRTNKLVVVASPAAFERIQAMVGQLDIFPTHER